LATPPPGSSPGGDCRLRHLLARFGSATATEWPVPEQAAEALLNKGWPERVLLLEKVPSEADLARC